ncbi:unnamed protein product [Clonostachys rosea f. rosea IK726]|uniref:Uncharacterized protein n=1 Tax=Clonostachys rosea f. rosea IK726 TaxID=1349383 RepID=A0ACA9TCC3_BIOOC|nr:unnamed protein product [Clonostachys rosea f. rosea IK726]
MEQCLIPIQAGSISITAISKNILRLSIDISTDGAHSSNKNLDIRNHVEGTYIALRSVLTLHCYKALTLEMS